MAWSNDGITFTSINIYQDSSGVPSIVRWKGDTLACVFQWFRAPSNSPNWDKVAIKFSYDAGNSWTIPKPINVIGLPSNYQRPFDPTLAVINSDSLRIYFSSSNGMPSGGLSSIVDTYSAKSSDGVNYTFEPNARFDDSTKPVIDPAIIFFNGAWHYAAPSGAPQDGAFHAVSSDGLQFVKLANYPSDNTHNWTGNFMVQNPTELRFYGSGQKVWYNISQNGSAWQGYTNTNINGGDPSVVKISGSSYLMIYVGEPYNSTVFTCGDSLVDPRDGKKYATVLIGSQCWMKQNLNYGVFKPNTFTGVPHSDVSNNGVVEKYCYLNDTTTALKYGGYYDWNEMMNYIPQEAGQGICPTGWHVPTIAEYQVLIALAGNNSNALKILGEGIAPNGTGTNATGFSAKHTGDRGSMGDFNGAGLVSTFWTSSQTTAEMARHIYMVADNAVIEQWVTQKSSGFACRCLKNRPTEVKTINFSLPQKMSLEQNFPNPFNPATTIRYSISSPGTVMLTVWNTLGQRVGELVNEQKEAGEYSVRFAASAMPSGMYFYTITTLQGHETRKMILSK